RRCLLRHAAADYYSPAIRRDGVAGHRLAAPDPERRPNRIETGSAAPSTHCSPIDGKDPMTTTLGLEGLLSEQLDLVAGRRVGLVASVSSVDAQLVSTAERFHQDPGINLVALFGPEHGLHGQAQAGVEVGVYTDPHLGLPVYSLYGQTYKPTPDM